MNTLTVKLPDDLDQELAAATVREQVSKSELVRRALVRYLSPAPREETPFVSALDRAGDLVGCLRGGPTDLASNPDHLADFGRT